MRGEVGKETPQKRKDFYDVTHETLDFVCLSVHPSEASELGNHLTDWILLFREYTYRYCDGFKLFSCGVGHPKKQKFPLQTFFLCVNKNK